MIGNNFDTPVVYQDLANYTMNPMMSPLGMYGGGMYGGMYGADMSYLGHVQLRPQPDHDKVQLMNKRNEECKETFKKSVLAIGAILLLGFIPRIYKGIKKSGFNQYFKDMFSKKQKSSQSSGHKVKNWFASKWQAVKGWFKKKPKVQTQAQNP